MKDLTVGERGARNRQVLSLERTVLPSNNRVHSSLEAPLWPTWAFWASSPCNHLGHWQDQPTAPSPEKRKQTGPKPPKRLASIPSRARPMRDIRYPSRYSRVSPLEVYFAFSFAHQDIMFSYIRSTGPTSSRNGTRGNVRSPGISCRLSVERVVGPGLGGPTRWPASVERTVPESAPSCLTREC